MTNAGNPYIDEGSQPRLRPSVVAFFDILGYQELVATALWRINSRPDFLRDAVAT